MPLGQVLATCRERIEPSKTPTVSFNYVGLDCIEGNTGNLLPYSPTKGATIRSAKSVFHRGEILFGKLRPYLNKVHVANEEGVCSTDILVFEARPMLNPQYAAYYLRSPSVLRVVSSLMVGANLPRIKSASLLGIDLPLPPLEEQGRLVSLLDAASNLRNLRNRADRDLAAVPSALFYEMFGDPVENRRGWEVRRVSSFAELYGGRNVNPAGGTETGGRFRVLKISAVTSGEFRPDESKPVPATYEPPAAHLVRAGDLLFSRANTAELVGATAYVFEAPPNLLLPDKLWRFVWIQPRLVEPLFIRSLFQTASMRRKLGGLSSGTGGAMKNISKAKMMSLEVPLPPLGLQTEFAQRIGDLSELRGEQASSRSRLDALFQSMLHRAFEGAL